MINIIVRYLHCMIKQTNDQDAINKTEIHNALMDLLERGFGGGSAR